MNKQELESAKKYLLDLIRAKENGYRENHLEFDKNVELWVAFLQAGGRLHPEPDEDEEEFITDMSPGTYGGKRFIIHDGIDFTPVNWAPSTTPTPDTEKEEAIKHLRTLVQTGRFAKEAKWFSQQASAEFSAAKSFLEKLK